MLSKTSEYECADCAVVVEEDDRSLWKRMREPKNAMSVDAGTMSNVKISQMMPSTS